ncbi:MAG: YqeG family HAD IIIA-type phosphatase [Acaryochloris sp. RU_4_1]|nr:YqeG family HAD IIIA-type phosphatase [Acaryochloris sp. SU_5_25]NJM67702.1 YqeG family HAD IIIA-type phosphatase [Acaryochloris sp. RU_4_1]NJN38755.1 YqeG family HAD IIIA-type phosphatase [Acaryochloridaceae cyanobacterium CSU_3_4]NJR56451.1 YqeG family HAD IIIA-type phosphatase [Acaryochloris sp. CRU_2_0]
MFSTSRWLSLLQPDLILKDSILQLTPQVLNQYQLKGLVLDVDDTVVSTKAAEASPELLAWLDEIKAETAIWLVSNNLKHSRIKRIATSLDLPYIYGASKPSRRKLRQAVRAMDLPYEQVAMVGDRLFTDVLAGNRLGLFTILVEPLTQGNLLHKIEFWLFQNLEKKTRP